MPTNVKKIKYFLTGINFVKQGALKTTIGNSCGVNENSCGVFVSFYYKKIIENNILGLQVEFDIEAFRIEIRDTIMKLLKFFYS